MGQQHGEILDRKNGAKLAEVDRVIDTGSPTVQAISGADDRMETTFHRKEDILVRGLPVETYRAPLAPNSTFVTTVEKESGRSNR